jgi:integrase
VEDYLREKAFRPRQAHEYGRAIRGFEGWLQEEAKLAGTVESVTRRVVADWRRDTLVRPSIHHKTANRAISCLSSFWRWLEMQGHVQGPDGRSIESPWRGMALAKGKTNGATSGATTGQSRSAEKRAFTDPELAALLTAEDTSPLLRDGMRCALLTGARIEELFSIRVGDLKLTEAIPYIDLKGSKTEAARRTIPIHPDLMELVGRRAKEKGVEAWLFDDLREVPEGSIVERSQPVSKAFTRLRRRLSATLPSLDQRTEGSRQADVDWHTFRRTFAGKARDALNRGAVGYSQWTIGQVMGHAGSKLPLEMTMGVYAGREGLEAKAVCVRAVRLPLLGEGQHHSTH